MVVLPSSHDPLFFSFVFPHTKQELIHLTNNKCVLACAVGVRGNLVDSPWSRPCWRKRGMQPQQGQRTKWLAHLRKCGISGTGDKQELQTKEGGKTVVGRMAPQRSSQR